MLDCFVRQVFFACVGFDGYFSVCVVVSLVVVWMRAYCCRFLIGRIGCFVSCVLVACFVFLVFCLACFVMLLVVF